MMPGDCYVRPGRRLSFGQILDRRITFLIEWLQNYACVEKIDLDVQTCEEKRLHCFENGFCLAAGTLNRVTVLILLWQGIKGQRTLVLTGCFGMTGRTVVTFRASKPAGVHL
jgi:hypothetical protein